MTRARFLAAIPITVLGWIGLKRAKRLVEVADVKDQHARSLQGKEWIRKRVILDGRDISTICYRAERYSDGSGRAFCYVKRDGKHVLRVGADGQHHSEKEILSGQHIEIMLAEKCEPLTAKSERS
jgi:hypothetical protein